MPFIVHWPAGIRSTGELRTTPAHVIDFVPTVLDLLDVEKPATWDGEPIPPAPGRSLAPALAEDVVIERDSLWWLHNGHRALRVGDLKLVAAKNEPWELYDLRDERAESHDLAEQQPEKVRELEAVWQRQLKDFSEVGAQPSVLAEGAEESPSSAALKPQQRELTVFTTTGLPQCRRLCLASTQR